MDAIATLLDHIRMFRLRDLFDILIVAFLIYKGIKLVRETMAAQLVKGIVILLVGTQVSRWLQLNSINYILVNVMQVGLIALLIVFQPELRRTLEKMGRSKLGNIFSIPDYDVENTVSQICGAAESLAQARTGAIVVVERDTKLADIAKTGIPVNGEISAQLLVNIFEPNTPLHDGAVIVGDNKIKAAACILPLSENSNIGKELGTRHRAAIGISENADCIVVVVSEETGKISVASNGSLTRNLSIDTLSKALTKSLKDMNSAEVETAKQKLKKWTVKKK